MLEGDQIKFPLGNTVNRWFNFKSFNLPFPSNLDFSQVREFTILPKNGAFYLDISYRLEKQTHELDMNQALSIDLGTSQNLAACVDTLGKSHRRIFKKKWYKGENSKSLLLGERFRESFSRYREKLL